MKNIIDLCDNTTVAPQVSALQSQASRISRMGVMLASATLATATASITSAPTVTSSGGAEIWRTGDANDPSFQSVLATATWASEYYSWKSAGMSFLSTLEVLFGTNKT